MRATFTVTGPDLETIEQRAIATLDRLGGGPWDADAHLRPETVSAEGQVVTWEATVEARAV